MTNQPTFDDVMLAILALDAYSRGKKTEKAIIPIGKEKLPNLVGSAIITEDAGENLEGADIAGFGASAYSWNGKTVIAYRGTDFGTEIFGANGHGVKFNA